MRGGVYRAFTRCLGVVGLVFSVFGGLANLRNSLSLSPHVFLIL